MAWGALVIAFALGNLSKFSFFSPDVHVSALDLVIFVLTILVYSSWFTVHRLTRPIWAFFSVGALSLVGGYLRYGFTAAIVGGMYLVRWVIYSLFFLTLVQLFKAHELKKLLLGLGLITVVVSLAQYILYPDVRRLEVLEWDPHYYRVVGTWLDPGFTGLLLVFTLTFLTLHPFKHRLVNLVAWISTYLAFALTYSRSSYLAFLAAMAWIAWRLKGGRFFVKMAGLLLLTVLVLPRAPGGEGVKLERKYSIWSRVASWQQALVVWSRHPVLGVGFNTYRYAQGASLASHAGAGADSSLLFVAATTGILGLAAYLWYLKRLWQLSIINYQLQAMLVALLVHSLFLNSLFYPAVMVWLSLSIPSETDFRLDQKR